MVKYCSKGHENTDYATFCIICDEYIGGPFTGNFQETEGGTKRG